MSFDDFKRTNLNYSQQEARFKALNLPYIAASNFYGMSMSEVIVEPDGNHHAFDMLSPGDISFLTVRDVPAGATGWRDTSTVEIGGISPGTQISTTLTWGDTRAITLLDGYIILSV